MRAVLLVPALALAACAPESGDAPAESREAIGRAGAASFGGKIKNIRIRQKGGANSYRVTTELGGDVADVLDEIETVELTWNSDATTSLALETEQHRGRFDYDFTADPTGGLYTITLDLTGTSHAVTVVDTLRFSIEADGDPVEVDSDALGGTVRVRAVSFPQADGDGYGMTLTTALQIDHVGEDGSTAGHFDWSGSSQGRVADRVTPAPTSPTSTALLDESSVTFGTTVSFAGDAVGTQWDIDADALDADGKRKAQGEFAVELVEVDNGDSFDPSVVSVPRNGKGTRSSASNTSTFAPLL